MSDTVGYVLGIAMVVLPAWASIQLGQEILFSVFETQSLLLAFPFP